MAIGQFAQVDLERMHDNRTLPDNCQHNRISSVSGLQTISALDEISQENETKEKAVIQLHCHLCDFVTISPKGLNLHLMSHVKFFKCELCEDISFASRRLYIRHMKEEHKTQGRLSSLVVEVDCRVCRSPYRQKIIKGLDPFVAVPRRSHKQLEQLGLQLDSD